MSALRYAYLHGFGGSPRGTKATALAERFDALGLTLYRPELAVPSFEQQTITAALEAIDALVAREEPGARWRFVGSSLGGFVGALWAARNPERVDRMVLLAPAFRLVERWPALMGPDAFAIWERSGAFFFVAPEGEPRPVHWEFVCDARRYPAEPDVPCPTHIVHGRRDELVPIAQSRRYAAARPHVTLTELDADHEMHGAVDAVWSEVRGFFELEPGEAGPASRTS